MIPFSKLENFFKVFPEVQRKLNKPRVKTIAKYILDGLDKKRLTFLSAITVTCKDEIQYDKELSQIDVDIQHKVLDQFYMDSIVLKLLKWLCKT